MVSDVHAYVQGLIGRPWERRGHHCWALVMQVEWDLFGRDVPPGPLEAPGRPVRRALFRANAEDYGWREVPAPEHGAIVRMYRTGGNPADMEHAGVYLAIERGVVLHNEAPQGVVIDTLLELRARGWEPRWFVPH
jgi:hypothetical protein